MFDLSLIILIWHNSYPMNFIPSTPVVNLYNFKYDFYKYFNQKRNHFFITAPKDLSNF